MIVVIFSIYFIRQPEIVDCDPVCDYHFSAITSTHISIKETVVSEVQIFDRTFLYCFSLPSFGVYMFFICFIFHILVHIHLRKWEQG